MSVDLLVPEVRSALGVSASFDDVKIPGLIRRTITRLLRDYHFPKALKRITFADLRTGDQQFKLPDGFKKELGIRIYDPTSTSWTDPLRKYETFKLPSVSGGPAGYWLEGTSLWIDTPIDVNRMGFSAVLWAETMDAASNEDWLTADYPDAVLYASILRGTAEFRKTEVAQLFAPLWTDEQTSLAIYLNELEWNNADMRMREAADRPVERYPIR
jgi:hypothetical protein